MAVVELKQVRDARAEELWFAMVQAKERADKELTLRDYHAAVEAYKAYWRAVGLSEAQIGEALRERAS
ncbi:hypothetical protein [Methylobacterium oxalidis]|uniref:hypothetical protein n=1 Tax=Methylobacterium oxalidis TaxID=944322 RepID=UPI00331499AF